MSNYTIHTGVWVNHDTSPILGATLTVSIRWGNYIIAALSSLVAWAGSRAWSLMTYYSHQRLAAKQDKDVLDQQLQIHFRAGASFYDSWTDGVGLQRAWSGRIERVKRRTLPVILMASVFFLAFAAAGVFVAEVATKSYQDVLVLAAPNDCGDLVFQKNADLSNGVLDVTSRYQNELEFEARNYARDIYYGSRTRETVFSRPQLPFLGSEVPCPYTNGTTCLGPNATHGPAWNVDSGPLDSHVHFGINAPPHDRIIFRESATCAVVDPTNLTTAPYWRIEKFNNHELNMTYIGILQEFGPDLGGDSNLGFEIGANLMFERTGFFSQRGITMANEADPTKALVAPPFNNTEADMVMITTTQSRMFYYAPVDDPYFLAHEAATGDEYAINLNATVYYATNPFSLMVCSDQAQICNPNNGQCSKPSGFYRLNDEVSNNVMGLNKAQLATAMRFVWNRIYVSGLVSNVARGTIGLLVAEENGVRSGNSVPPTQWTKEVDLWFASGLASLQQSLLEWVAKPWPSGHPEARYPIVNMTALSTAYTVQGLGAQKESLCRNQLIRSSAAVQNFSVLALVIVVALSLTIIVAAVAVPLCVDLSRARTRRRAEAGMGANLSARAEAGRVARLADDKYSLLAMALQGAGVRGWVRGDADIPVTEGRVPVSPPRETRGVASYPAAYESPSADCKERPGSVGGESDPKAASEAAWDVASNVSEKGGGGRWDDIELEKGSPPKLRKRETERTLVGSPVQGEFPGEDTIEKVIKEAE